MKLDDLITHNIIERPHYAFCMLRGAELAKRLDFQRVTTIEFGVAGGNGLVAMERIASFVETEIGISVDVVGFDNRDGMPPPTDYRDIPYHWRGGYFPMDETALRRRLTRATLVLGNVTNTLDNFIEATLDAAPIGAVIFDVDYYSSTASALSLFSAPAAKLLPRIFCYFDDTSGEKEMVCDFTGVRAAIADFNEASAARKIAPFYGARDRYGLRRFRDGLMCLHQFSHPTYCQFVGDARKDAILSLSE
jgi:hypothetical protein